MEHDICTALAENNRPALKKAVNTFLRQLPAEGDDQENFEKIRGWLAGLHCVDVVENSPVLLDSYPPVKQFIITLKGAKQPTTIGILLQKNQWTFNL
jgi:hypothetical protein